MRFSPGLEGPKARYGRECPSIDHVKRVSTNASAASIATMYLTVTTIIHPVLYTNLFPPSHLPSVAPSGKKCQRWPPRSLENRNTSLKESILLLFRIRV